jgi:hypothetical protein
MNFTFFLKDDAGNYSSVRLLMLGWGLISLAVWTVISVKTWEMVAPPWEVMGIVFSLAGVKAAQKYGEAPKPGG